jgi:hypothetical protein
LVFILLQHFSVSNAFGSIGTTTIRTTLAHKLLNRGIVSSIGAVTFQDFPFSTGAIGIRTKKITYGSRKIVLIKREYGQIALLRNLCRDCTCQAVHANIQTN